MIYRQLIVYLYDISFYGQHSSTLYAPKRFCLLDCSHNWHTVKYAEVGRISDIFLILCGFFFFYLYRAISQFYLYEPYSDLFDYKYSMTKVSRRELSELMEETPVSSPIQHKNIIPPMSEKSFKFGIQLNDEQKEAKNIILANTISVLHGKAGSGKTLLACQIALDGLMKKEFTKIVVTRPTVSKEDIGFLPGTVRDKMDVWLQPIYQNFYLLLGKDKRYLVEQWLNDGTLEIVPVSFMRGLTFLDACVIVDEAQNITDEQMEMIVTRIGLRSKMIICGDVSQVDLKHRTDSGFKFMCKCAEKIPDMVNIELKENHRHEIVEYLIEAYAEHHAKDKKKAQAE